MPTHAPGIATAAPHLRPEGARPVARRNRVAILAAVLAATSIAAVAWGTWEGLGAARHEAATDSSLGLAPLQGRIALGLLLAMAAALAGSVLVRWSRLPGETPATARVPATDPRLLQALLDGTTEAMLLLGPRGEIHHINPAAEILFGRLAEDLAGTPVAALLPSLDPGQNPTPGAPQANGVEEPAAGPTVRETEARRADGHRFQARLWLRGLPVDGEPYRLIAVHDLSEQDHQSRELAYLRSRDPLTGLLNRIEFRGRLATTAHPPSASREASLLPGATAPPQGWILCYMDLDQFTLINSTCGPSAGDKLLQQVARLVEAKLAPAALVARLGGDEFAALLRGADMEAAIDLCESLMQTVRGFLFTWQDRSFDVSISIGLAPWDPLTESSDDALGRAETACQLAKRGGRNRIHVYREGEAAFIQLRGDMHLVSTINQALSDGSFVLLAQPIVPLSTERPTQCHFEILVRMVDDEGHLVVPARFIPAAEHYILMPAVDRWIINHLFGSQADNLRAWHAAHPDKFLFAVNLSGTTVTDDGFLRYLKRQFADWQVPYSSICFEITETAAVGSLDQARTLIHELSALGCHFALDDFGTGLSSYAYLRALGVHYLKIDGSFVRGLATDETNRAMVESINHIGHVLGLKTIAEWVEDEATLAVLRDLEIDYAQGYAIGTAVALADFTLARAVSACPVSAVAHERSSGAV